ncbi:MAG: ABC-F family ATP-binding cassette domain-containing protein [Candidatus Cloacimonetes bacterium]|nr:ABC-F family ATP-binding cassette domain-containing protein [Candidatus Cloacimonadota bacterium]
MNSQITIKNLDFYYANQHENIFTDLNLELNSSWKLGITGPNGMGKSTLISLITGHLKPCKGSIQCQLNTKIFPPKVLDSNLSTLDVIKDTIAPFSRWESQMNMLLNNEDAQSIKRYLQLLELYEENNPYQLQSEIEKKWSLSGFDSEILNQKFSHLSHGQKTMALLISVFLGKKDLVILDEPSTHLDHYSKSIISSFLKKQDQFILVSHDRSFLNDCVDHLLYLDGVENKLISSNYQQFLEQKEIKSRFEESTLNKLKSQVKKLKQDAQNKRSWSLQKEKTKHQSADSGHVGAVAAKIMKRALNSEKRKEDKLIQKQEVLKTYTKKREIKFIESKNSKMKAILTVRNLSFGYGENPNLISKLFFTLKSGDRLAITGKNGSGKSSLIRLLTHESHPHLKIRKGSIQWSNNKDFCYIQQWDPYSNNKLAFSIAELGKDARFINTLACLGLNIARRKLDSHCFSPGELKKIEIAKCLCTDSSLLIWDEALANLDLPTKEALEKLIVQSHQTMIFVEHDHCLMDKVATKVVKI